MNRIRELRERAGMKVEELANLLGISSSYLYDLELGRRRLYDTLLDKLCQIFGVDANYILGLSVNPLTASVLVPVVEEVSAGEPIFAEETIVDYEELPKRYFPQGPENFFWLIVKGDSMVNAQIPNGSWVLVRRQPTVDNGDIAAVWIEDEGGTVKRVRFFDGQILLQPESSNPKHAPRLLKPEQVRIIGKVMEVKIKT